MFYRNTLLIEAAIGINHDVARRILEWWRSCNHSRNHKYGDYAVMVPVMFLMQVKDDTFWYWLPGAYAR